MKLEKLAGITSEILQIFIQDTSKTDGSGLTGLAFGTSGLTAYYHRDSDTTATAIALVTMTVGTFTSSGFKEIDATNMPGWYQFCPPNTAFASGARSCGIHLKGATNMAHLPIEVQLVSNYNPDATLQSYPSNFATQVIDANGRVEALVDVTKNVALANFTFMLTDSTVHTPLTGKVNANFTLKKERIDAAAAATLSGTITEVDSTNLPGIYQISLIAGELNGNVVTLYFQTADSDPITITLVTSA